MSKRTIPNSHEIKEFFHCSTCFKDKPADVSPADWSRLECGWTVLGFQVWCRRCNLNLVHVDFEGQQHPANTQAQKPPRLQ